MNIYSDYEAQTERAYYDQQENAAIGEIITACAKAIFDRFEASTMAELQRTIYKYTPCGPAISFELFNYDEDDSFEAHIGNCEPRQSPFVYVGDKRAATITEPWLSIAKIGVSSIVEGSDVEVPVEWIELDKFADDDKYEGDIADLAKAAANEFGQLVESVNLKAEAIWEWANTCPDGSEETYAEMGLDCPY